MSKFKKELQNTIDQAIEALEKEKDRALQLEAKAKEAVLPMDRLALESEAKGVKETVDRVGTALLQGLLGAFVVAGR